MDCTELSPLLAGHAESALPAIERAAAMGHLAGCGACAERMRGLIDRTGRLEAVLAPYHVELGTVDVHLPAARAALGRRWSDIDLAPLVILALLVGPGVVGAAIGLVMAVFDLRAWWYPGGAPLDLATAFLAGILVPGAACVFFLAAWRRMRRENRRETFESILLALMAGGCAWLAWWPIIGAVLEGVAGGSPGLPTRATMAHSQLLLGALALLVATLVTAPLVQRPAVAAAREGTTEAFTPKRSALRAKLQDLLRLFSLAAFERCGDLLESTRAAEEDFDVVVHRLNEVPDADAPLRHWVAGVAAEVVPDATAGAGRSTLALKKVATRRELEQTLHGLPGDARAVTYLRIAQKTPLHRIAAMLRLTPGVVVRGYDHGLEALAAFAEQPSNAG
jgi:hypothetical protein